MMLVDSHVNLHGEHFDDDLDEVVKRARLAGVKTMLNICCKISDFDQVIDVAQRYENIYASIGTHPHDAKETPDVEPAEIIVISQHPKVIGIGETGLDFHYNYSEREVQYTNFLAHIKAARETQLPLIIHSRNADEEMADILEQEMQKGGFPALLHCYTGGAELARRAANLGLYFSVSGILTFKNANELREITKNLPEDRLMIETDCPYLTPIPHRGRRNEPSFVTRVAEDLAALKNWSYEETCERTTNAFFDLFAKAERPIT